MTIEELAQINGVKDVQRDPSSPIIIVIIDSPISNLPTEVDGCQIVTKEFHPELGPSKEKRDYNLSSEWRGTPERDEPGKPPTEFDRHEARLKVADYNIETVQGQDIVNTESTIKAVLDRLPARLDVLLAIADTADLTDISFETSATYDHIQDAQMYYSQKRYDTAAESAKDAWASYKRMVETYIYADDEIRSRLEQVNPTVTGLVQDLYGQMLMLSNGLDHVNRHYRSISGSLSNKYARVDPDTDYSSRLRDAITNILNQVDGHPDIQRAREFAMMYMKGLEWLKTNDREEFDLILAQASSVPQLKEILKSSLIKLQPNPRKAALVAKIGDSVKITDPAARYVDDEAIVIEVAPGSISSTESIMLRITHCVHGSVHIGIEDGWASSYQYQILNQPLVKPGTEQSKPYSDTKTKYQALKDEYDFVSDLLYRAEYQQDESAINLLAKKFNISNTHDIWKQVNQMGQQLRNIERDLGIRKSQLSNKTAQSIVTVGSFIQSKIHESFTVTADRMLQAGLMNTEERIALSSMIGEVLEFLRTKMKETVSKVSEVEVPRDIVRVLISKANLIQGNTFTDTGSAHSTSTNTYTDGMSVATTGKVYNVGVQITQTGETVDHKVGSRPLPHPQGTETIHTHPTDSKITPLSNKVAVVSPSYERSVQNPGTNKTTEKPEEDQTVQNPPHSKDKNRPPDDSEESHVIHPSNSSAFYPRSKT